MKGTNFKKGLGAAPEGFISLHKGRIEAQSETAFLARDEN